MFNGGRIDKLTLAQIRFLEMVMLELTGQEIKNIKRVKTSELSDDIINQYL